MNSIVDIKVVIFVRYNGMRNVLFCKCFEGEEELKGTICLLKMPKGGVRKCRCFCYTVWHVTGHVSDHPGYLLCTIIFIILVVEHVLI
jgi:hypothetical protein